MVQATLAHRCISCRLRIDLCVCAFAPALPLRTSVVVLMHVKEWRRSGNSGHYARLAIQDARVSLWGKPDERPSLTGLFPQPKSPPLVLFPGQGAEPLTPDLARDAGPSASLLVLDGNWTQADHMAKRLPGIDKARFVCLDGPTLDLMRMRRNVFADRMSTFEALAQAVGILEDDAATTDRLLAFHQLVLARQMHLRGRLDRAGLAALDASLIGR